jgi:DNA (cytosine-5)-methyltransferase 1
VLDLFSGAGGMSLGFTQTGKFHVTVAVEKHPHAKETYEGFHKDTKVLEDILDINDYDEFKKEYGYFDIVVGGPPCQGFSNANRQKNHIISQNNSLIKKYVEVIENLKPMAFVMENVRMLRSATHRFYISRHDDFSNLEVNLRTEKLCLYEGIYPVNDLLDYLLNIDVLEKLLLSEKDLNGLKSLIKNSYSKDSNEVIEKKGKNCLKILNEIPERTAEISEVYTQYEQNLLSYFVGYIEGDVSFKEAVPFMEAYIKLQKLLSNAKELLDNDIIINDLTLDDNGIFIEVQSITVVEYINKKLGRYYLIDDDVLNAAWFGAPQLRERYIAVGIKKELIAERQLKKPFLPKPKYEQTQYRKVQDAIIDLEQVEPNLTIGAPPIRISKKFVKTDLTKELRDTETLHNHVITESREKALKRFAALDPGQNFHDLKKELIDDTYSKPERTQNSIYLRLDYKKPCGTVTNVRKSMWIHPKFHRALSIREAARLQTFPDSFIFKGNKDSQYQQIGNAVPPMMAKAIANKLANLLEEIPEASTGKDI